MKSVVAFIGAAALIGLPLGTVAIRFWVEPPGYMGLDSFKWLLLAFLVLVECSLALGLAARWRDHRAARFWGLFAGIVGAVALPMVIVLAIGSDLIRLETDDVLRPRLHDIRDLGSLAWTLVEVLALACVFFFPPVLLRRGKDATPP